MSEITGSTDIEKKSLEAHVELCSQRYKFLESKLNDVEEKMVEISTSLGELKKSIIDINEKRYKQILAWGTMLISSLSGMVAYLFMRTFQ